MTNLNRLYREEFIEMFEPVSHIPIEEKKELFRYMENTWFRTRLPHRITTTNKLATYNTIEEWCNNNCEGNWAIFTEHYDFELETDATLFKLTWL